MCKMIIRHAVYLDIRKNKQQIDKVAKKLTFRPLEIHPHNTVVSLGPSLGGVQGGYVVRRHLE